MKYTFSGLHRERVEVRMRARNWTTAGRAVMYAAIFQPAGYKLTNYGCSKRPSGGNRGGSRGARVEVVMHYQRASSSRRDCPILRTDVAQDLFERIEATAQGREVSPPIPGESSPTPSDESVDEAPRP